jgi:hypothetical protein
MSQPYVGEVRLVGFSFAPVGWSICNGSLVSISENPTLFQLIGTTYGGDGQNTYALPNLQGRIPVHQGSNGISTYVPGQITGVESVTVTLNQYPTHTHSLEHGWLQYPHRQHGGQRIVSLYHPSAEPRNECGDGGLQRRRKPTTRKQATLPGAELDHRSFRCIPQPKLIAT